MTGLVKCRECGKQVHPANSVVRKTDGAKLCPPCGAREKK